MTIPLAAPNFKSHQYVGSVLVSFLLQTNRLYEFVIAIRLSDGLEDIQSDK
jgi:hypothetical protein